MSDGQVAKLLLNYIFNHDIDLGDFFEMTKEYIEDWLPMLQQYDPNAKLEVFREGKDTLYELDFIFNGELSSQDWETILEALAQNFDWFVKHLGNINWQIRELGSNLRILYYHDPQYDKPPPYDTPDITTSEVQMIRFQPVTKSFSAY